MVTETFMNEFEIMNFCPHYNCHVRFRFSSAANIIKEVQN